MRKMALLPKNVIKTVGIRDWALGIGEWGMGNGEWGMGIRD
jgi:hypothetical protein